MPSSNRALVQRAETQDQFSLRGQDTTTADSLDPLVDLGIQRVFFVHPLQLRALVCTVLRHSL
jgi:hypothetical protein